MAETLKFTAQLIDKISGPSRKIARGMKAVVDAQRRIGSSAKAATAAQSELSRQLRDTDRAAKGAALSMTRAARAQRTSARMSRRYGGAGGGGGGPSLAGDLAGGLAVGALAAGWYMAGRAVATYTTQAGVAIAQAGIMAQRSRAALGVVSGSASEGAAEFERLRGTIVELGMDMDSAVAEFQRLRNVGFGGAEALEITRMTADLSALGVRAESVGSIMNAMGKIMAQGKLQGDELMMLAEAGVDVGKIYRHLAKTLGVTVDEVKRLQTAGKLEARPSIDAIKAAVLEVTGGTAAGDAAKQLVANTLDGALRQLKASLQSWMIALGDAVMPTLNGISVGVQRMFAELEASGELPKITAAVTDVFVAFAALLKSSAGADTLVRAARALVAVLEAMAWSVRQLAAHWDILSSAMKAIAVLSIPFLVGALALLVPLIVLVGALSVVLWAVWEGAQAAWRGLTWLYEQLAGYMSAITSAVSAAVPALSSLVSAIQTVASVGGLFGTSAPSQAGPVAASAGSVSNSKSDNRSWEVNQTINNTFPGGSPSGNIGESARRAALEAIGLAS